MKKLSWAVGLLVVLAGVGVVLFVTLYSPDAQRAEVERRLSEAFGRPAHVGPMRLTFRGGFGVEARDVRVDGDPSFGDRPLLDIARVRADVGIWNYLVRRGTGITGLELEAPKITLVKREDGVWNWSDLGRAPGPAASGVAPDGSPILMAAVTGVALAGDPARVTPKRITATSAEVVLVDRTVTPAKETPYRGLALDTGVEPASGGYRLRGRMTADSEPAGGEPISADLTFDLTLEPPDDVPVWRAHGNVPAGRIATRRVRFDSVSTDVALDETQTLRFESFALGLYGGGMNGSFAVDLSTPNNRFVSKGELANVSVGDALASRPDLGGVLRGQASGRFALGGDLGDFDSTLASLAGDGHLTIAAAELTSVNLMAEIARQGGLPQIFDEPGTRADRIDADVRVGSGRFSFSKASVEGINGYANVSGNDGWIDVKSPATLHLEGAATLLPPLFDKVVQANPAAGAIVRLVAARPNFAVPLTIDGPLGHPSVSVRWSPTGGLPF